MTMHTGGWIEVRLPDWDGPRPVDMTVHEPMWEAIFYAEPFITWEYQEACRRAGFDQVAAIRHVGLPTDVSARVRADYEADANAWAGAALPEWAEWRSITGIEWHTSNDSGWMLIMRMGAGLAQRYGEDNVRLVLWSMVVMG